MKVSSIDFFGVIVTYRVEARKAGPTVFLSLRSSDGVHIDGAGRVCYEHKGHIFRAPDAIGLEEYVRTLVPECLRCAFDPNTKAGCSLRKKFAQNLPLGALIAADFDRVALDMKWANSTKKEHKKLLDLLVSKLGWTPFCAITQEMFAFHLREGGFSSYQINGQICAFRALIAYEQAHHLISEHFIDTFTMGNRRTVVGPRDASRHFEKNILTHAQVREIVATCAENLESSRGYLYFGLILMLITGITIGELCALTWGSFSFSNTYTGITVIEISAETKLAGEVYRTEELNGPRRRRPDEFDRWLKVFFRGFDFAQQKEAKNLLKHPDRVLRETFRAAMAICGCDEEEVRYLYGSAPESVFARNYCAYDDPRELAKLAAVLDKYAISLTETPCDVSEFKISRKDEDVVMTSTPNCRFSGDVIIDIDGISGHNFEAGSDLLLCIKSNDNIFFTAKLKSKET